MLQASTSMYLHWSQHPVPEAPLQSPASGAAVLVSWVFISVCLVIMLLL